jgi:hypothetical protein
MEIGVLIVGVFVVGFLVLIGIVHLCKSAGCLSRGVAVPATLDKVSIEEASSLDDDMSISELCVDNGEEGREGGGDRHPAQAACQADVDTTETEDNDDDDQLEIADDEFDDDEDEDADEEVDSHTDFDYGDIEYFSDDLDLSFDLDGTREEIVYAPEGLFDDGVLVMEDEYATDMKESLL